MRLFCRAYKGKNYLTGTIPEGQHLILAGFHVLGERQLF